MTYIGTPTHYAQKVAKTPLTRSELHKRNSFKNQYRLAIANVAGRKSVELHFGSAKKALASKDLLIALRGCKRRLQSGPIPLPDYLYLLKVIRRLATQLSVRPNPWVSVSELIELKRIAQEKNLPCAPTEIHLKPDNRWRRACKTSLRVRAAKVPKLSIGQDKETLPEPINVPTSP